LTPMPSTGKWSVGTIDFIDGSSAWTTRGGREGQQDAKLTVSCCVHDLLNDYVDEARRGGSRGKRRHIQKRRANFSATGQSLI
jgi:hypothetical protein